MTQTGARVLIVEDETIVAMDLVQRVEKLGYQVVGAATSGELAIQRAEALRPDLVLMDINLPGGMDGVAAAEVIRRAWDAPVVFLTAFSDPATVARASAAEPFGYIMKPVDDRELEVAIAVALHRHEATRRAGGMERWLATKMQSIGDGVITTDLSGRVTFMNVAAQRLTEYRLAEGRSRSLDDVMLLVNEEDLSPVEGLVTRALEETMAGGLTRRGALVRRNGEQVPVDSSAARIRDDDGKVTGVVVVLRDVTEQRKAADALRESQKAEAGGRLAGGVVQDYNNQMTMVLSSTELVLEDPRLPTDLREILIDLRRAGARAASLTPQLLTYGRRRGFRPQTLDLSLVIADIRPLLTRLLGNQIELRTSPIAPAAVIRADRAEIEELIIKLAANSRDAMPSGGTLTISASGDESCVSLQVGDTGAGMTRDVMDHLFEPFFTTKKGSTGTGLGLAAVRETVDLAEGLIDVESAPGAGTTFRFSFPSVNGKGYAPAAAEARSPVFLGEGKTVLVVDADASIRLILTAVLRGVGFTVLEAKDVPEALEVLRQRQEELHLVIADIGPSARSCEELARQIVGARVGTKALLMSGHPEANLSRLRAGAPGTRFLRKPFNRTGFLLHVRELLSAEPLPASTENGCGVT